MLADKSTEMKCHVNMVQNLRGMFPTSGRIHNMKTEAVWRAKGGTNEYTCGIPNEMFLLSFSVG